MDSLEKNQPDILDKHHGISVEKENGTSVDYFLFDTFELHTNKIPSKCIQDWHAHQAIEEIVVVHSGTLCLEWVDSVVHQKEVISGEIIRMNNSIHRISNLSDADVECTIFRFVSPNENQSAVIKSDKVIFSDEEINKMKANKDEK